MSMKNDSNDNGDSKDGGKDDESHTLDIYHFQSRWDMILVAAVIVALLVILVYLFLSSRVVS